MIGAGKTCWQFVENLSLAVEPIARSRQPMTDRQNARHRVTNDQRDINDFSPLTPRAQHAEATKVVAVSRRSSPTTEIT